MGCPRNYATQIFVLHSTNKTIFLSERFRFAEKEFSFVGKIKLAIHQILSLHFPLVFDTQNGHRNWADFEQVWISLYLILSLSLSHSRCAPVLKKCQCRLCTLNHCQLQWTKGEDEAKHMHMLNGDFKLAPKRRTRPKPRKICRFAYWGQIVINAIHRSANILFLDKSRNEKLKMTWYLPVE